MIDCNLVLSELWDWLADRDSHPLTRDIQDHLTACPACRGEADATRGLRASLKETPEPPSAGFDERLRRRLAAAGAPVGGAAAPAGRTVKVDFWRRPLALVATGAAAVLLIGLATDRLGGPQALPGAAGTLAETPAAAPSAPLRAAGDPAPIGVVGDRAWNDGDSLSAGAADPAHAEPLHPVSSQER